MPELPEPWFQPADEQAQSFRSEALSEIGADHEIAGRGHVAIAVCSGCDRVVFQVDDGTFAIVHLTWTGSGTWPITRRPRSISALQRAASDHHH